MMDRISAQSARQSNNCFVIMGHCEAGAGMPDEHLDPIATLSGRLLDHLFWKRKIESCAISWTEWPNGFVRMTLNR
jgi:hypothetical protein